ncbi:transposase, partial [bacterium]
PEEDQALLRELITRRQQLMGIRVAEQNRRLTARTKAVRKNIDAHICWLTKQLESIDKDLDTLVRQSPLWCAQEDLLASVPGVGTTTARTLLATLPELGTLDRKQVAALAGLAPYARESGRWKGKRFIGGGRPAVRTALYMSALTAIRHNPSMRAFYRTLLAKGKPKKVALTACMRKLLTVLNAMVRDNKPWSAGQVEA